MIWYAYTFWNDYHNHLINTSNTSHSSYLFCMCERKLKIYSLCKFQVCNTIFLTVVTMLYIKSSELFHSITESLYPWPTFPQPPAPGNHQSIVCSYEFDFFLRLHLSLRFFLRLWYYTIFVFLCQACFTYDLCPKAWKLAILISEHSLDTNKHTFFGYVFWNKRKASLTLITRASEFGIVDEKTARALSCIAEQSWLGAVLTQPVGDNSLIIYAWALQCPLPAWAILLCLGKGTAHQL